MQAPAHEYGLYSCQHQLPSAHQLTCPPWSCRRAWQQPCRFGPGSVFHLVHVVPEPQMLHLWAG